MDECVETELQGRPAVARAGQADARFMFGEFAPPHQTVIPSLSRDLGTAEDENIQPHINRSAKILRLRALRSAQDDKGNALCATVRNDNGQDCADSPKIGAHREWSCRDVEDAVPAKHHPKPCVGRVACARRLADRGFAEDRRASKMVLPDGYSGNILLPIYFTFFRLLFPLTERGKRQKIMYTIRLFLSNRSLFG